MRRAFLAGATLVAPDRIVSGQTLVIEDRRIADITAGPRAVGEGERHVDLTGLTIVPGFIDVHIHGVAGIDVLDGRGAVANVAARLPRWGVTAFCPTSVACPPDVLTTFLEDVRTARSVAAERAARVLPAHLESNFISSEYCGAQPVEYVRTLSRSEAQPFSGEEILDVIIRHRADVGIVTLAPEIEGGLDLVRRFVSEGIRVSLGHSAASFDQAQEAIISGASQATHLFNRMRPMAHRDPGLAGAALASEEVAAEIIIDGRHVHPAIVRVALAAKSSARVMAISDGTAGSGLPPGSRAALGGRPITVHEVARLDDGTIAGSVATMDRVFATLVTACDLDLVRASELCSTTPARELGLFGFGVLTPGAVADLAILNDRLEVVQTWIDGEPAFRSSEI